MAGFKNGNPGCACCGGESPCGCRIPAVLDVEVHVTQAAAAFYFIQVPAADPEPSSYAMTYTLRPAVIPGDVPLLFLDSGIGINGVGWVTMPESAWFAGPIFCVNGYGYDGGSPVDLYFYGWFSGCVFMVMILVSPYAFEVGGPAYGEPWVDDGPSYFAGAGSAVVSFGMRTCVPFEMRDYYFNGTDSDHYYTATGFNDSDDVALDAGGNRGGYINFRSEKSYDFLRLDVTDSTGVVTINAHVGDPLTASVAFDDLVGGSYAPPGGTTVTWSSSDPSVLDVDVTTSTGQITFSPVGPGSATLTAAVAGDPNFTGTAPTASLTVT